MAAPRAAGATVRRVGEEPQPPRLERALRRVVVGYRLFGATWLTLLAGVAVATGDPPAAAAVAGPTAALAAGWAGLTAVVAARRPAALASPAWLVLDVAVASWTVVAPSVAGAGAAAFYGGYPFSAVLLAATTRGLGGALPAGGVLAAVTTLRLVAEGAPALPEAVGALLLYLAGGGLVAWGAGVLRRHDEQLRAAERSLAAERAARVRSQERAETAAHLHDSVLQTLALIQRRSGDAAEVTTLARRSERELRDWLTGTGPAAAARVVAALRAAAAEVEATHRVAVEVVTVGDAPLDDAAAAVVAAAREALTNAAKHAGVDRVALYAEAGARGIEVYVRDRGGGFAPGAVPADRRGIAESIVGRVRRHGGTAAVRSAPGAGTEVRLTLPPEQ